MAKQDKLVEDITSMDVDFSKWFTDIVKKADLIDYSSVRGCMIFRPYGYAIWENIQKILDDRFKETGHENVYMPLFIPESLLQKEKDHIEGFAPEVAWVTVGGSEELTERMCVRPTSETLFCEHYANVIRSYRDLPMLYNQWCSVVRWEKTSRPFLRNVEFLWQEGHTMHETKEDAEKETLRMLNIYEEFCKEHLCMPVLKGRKTDKEKFAGAEQTYTIEAMMHDGKALQSGTSHYFGTGFSEAFDISFTDRNNKKALPHQTSWGVSTRLIGGIIMTHGDDNGLVLPPSIAPIQVIVIPIAQHKDGVIAKSEEVLADIKRICRAKLDVSDNSAGWKFSQYEMKGVPLRIELGPRDISNNECVIVRRDNREKIVVKLDELKERIPEILNDYKKAIYKKASDNRESKTFTAYNIDEMKNICENGNGFIKALWCGDVSCEDKLKDEVGVSSRCIPFDEKDNGNCVCCGKKSEHLVYWGKAY